MSKTWNILLSRKTILYEILIFSANIIVFRNHFRPRFKVISKQKKAHHLKSSLSNAIFVLQMQSSLKKRSRLSISLNFRPEIAAFPKKKDQLG